jgi:hypothetical protein
MESTDRTHQLLEEIRDLQRESLTEYRKVTQQSLEMQSRAVRRQEEIGGIYKRMLTVGVLIIVPLLVLLAYLLIQWWPRLFR